MKVSIVVNNRNYGLYVGEAVRSALAQTYDRTEVIAVDDASTDGSAEALARIGGVKLVRSGGRGQGAALGAGFAASTGDLVMFLDADDRLHPEAAARVADAWRPGVSKIHFPLRTVDASGRPTGRLTPDERPLPRGDLRDRVLRTGVYRSPPTSGNAFARSALERLLPVDDWPISADSPLFLGAALLGDVAAVDLPLGDYRVHGNNAFAGRADDESLASTVWLDAKRQAWVERLARELGLEPHPCPERHNPHRCRIRMRLLRRAPHLWPLGCVRRRDLLVQGLLAAWRAPDLSVRERLGYTAGLVMGK
jgi:glycosyltransferase involved in cell wall biosynthesis